MTRTQQISLAIAGVIIAADTLMLGMPTKFAIFAHDGLPQLTLYAFSVVGSVSIGVPGVYGRTRRDAMAIYLLAGVAAYLVALLGVSRFDSPIFWTFGEATPFVETFLMTWSLTGAFGLGILAFWRPRWVAYHPIVPVRVGNSVAVGFYRDPAFLTIDRNVCLREGEEYVNPYP